MRKILLQTILVALVSFNVCYADAVTPQQALDRLMKGNQRYMKDALEHPNRTSERREASASKQKPFATIVGCADSRVVPEIVFDEGVADLFVVRVAGNVVGPLELDSVEFSTAGLGSSLVLVLGHEACGAVDAVVQGQTKDIEAVAALIEPAVKEARAQGNEDLLVRSIKANAKHMRDSLLQSPVLAKLVADKKLEIVAGYYHLRSGEVELLKD